MNLQVGHGIIINSDRKDAVFLIHVDTEEVVKLIIKIKVELILNFEF